jgi:hypothetical protein
MSAWAISLVALLFMFGGALLGVLLPGHRLNDNTKDVVKLGTGLIGTLAALVLGLLVASAKSSFDTQSSQVKQLTATVVVLDNLLTQYGPESRTARNQLRSGIAAAADRIWLEHTSNSANSQPFEVSSAGDTFLRTIQGLTPASDAQRSLKDQAIQITAELSKVRLLLFTQKGGSTPAPFLVVLIFWLTIIFVSFGLFAQPNSIVIGALFLFTLSASGTMFLFLELDQPFDGPMQISSTPLRNALPTLGP